MLPYSLRKDLISFTDKKWDWRYSYNQEGKVNEKYPTLYELQPSGAIKERLCQVDKPN